MARFPGVENLKGKVRQAFLKNKRNARDRIKSGANADRHFLQKMRSSERRLFERFSRSLPSENGRGLFDWQGFRNYIHAESKSTDLCKEYADILVSAITDGVYDEDIHAEWHHQRSLCLFGSVESDDNYVRLRPVLHVKVHAALCYFFPSYYPLQNSLNFTVHGNNSRSSEDVSAVALLKDEDKLAEIGLAREKAAIVQSEKCQGNAYALKPTSSDPKVQKERDRGRDKYARTNKRKELEEQGLPVPPELQKRPKGKKCDSVAPDKYTEKTRLRNQRVQLKKDGRVFQGPYTAEEIRKWNAEHPNAQLRFYTE